MSRRSLLVSSHVFALLAILAVGCGRDALRDDLLPRGDLAEVETALQGKLAEAPADPELKLRMGILLHEQGRFDEADPLLQQAASALPRSVDALHWLGLNALAKGDAPLAVQHLLAASELDPLWLDDQSETLARALRLSVDQALDAGHPKDAARWAEQLTALDGVDLAQDSERLARSFIGLGDVYYDAGYYRDALAAYEKAGRFSDPATMEFKRARVLALLGQQEEASQAFDAYLGAAGQGGAQAERAEALRRIGSFYESNFKFEEAEKAYRESVELDPGQPGIYGDIALLYLKLRRYDEAKQAFAKQYALAGDVPKQVEARMAAARLYIKFQSPEQAIATLRDAIAIAPRDIVPRNVLARLLLRSQRRDEVAKLYQDYATTAGTGEALLEAAEALAELGLQNDAIALYKEALAKPGAEARLHLEVGRLEHQLGHDEARDAAYQAYIAASTDPVAALAEVGLEYKDERLDAKAVTALADVVKARPGLEKAAFALADLYRARSEHTAETRLLDRFVASAPDPISARLAVGRRYTERGEPDLATPHLEAAASADAAHDAQATEALMLLGGIHLAGKQKSPEKASLAYRAAIRRSPDTLATAREVARKAANQPGLTDLLVDVYEQITSLAPAEPDSLFLLGQAYVAANRFDQSIPAFTRYIERSESRAEAIEKVATYLFGKGRDNEALAMFSQLSGDDIQDPELHRRLARLYRTRGDSERARQHYERFLASGAARPRDLRTVGDELFNGHLYDLAARAYEQAAVSSPAVRDQVAFNLAVSYLQLRQPERAERAFDTFLASETDKLKAHERIAQRYYEDGQLQRAHRHFKSAFVKENRRALQAMLPRVADILVKLGSREQVVELGHEYIRLQGSRASARATVADLFRSLGLHADAVRIYREILVDQPSSKETMVRVAEELLALGDTRAALDELDRIVDLSGFSPRSVQEAVELLVRRGLLDQALAMLEQADARGKRDSALSLERGALLLRKGKVDEAHEHLVAALVLTQEPDTLLKRIYSLYEEAERNDLALDITRRAAALYPSEPEHQLQMVELLMAAGQRDEADQAAWRYLKADELGAAKLAETYRRHGEYERAIANYRKALEQPLVSGDGDLLRELARTLLFVGEGAELDSAVAQYLASARDQSRATIDAAVAYELASRTSEVVRYLVETDRANPRPELRRAIALTLLAAGRFDEARSWFELYMDTTTPRAESAVLQVSNRRDDDTDPVVRTLKVAGTYRSRGLVNEAVRVLDEGMSRWADSPQMLEGLVTVLVDRGEIRRALAEVEGFLDRGGILDDESARGIARRFIVAGREREAIFVLEPALRQRYATPLAVELVRLYLMAGEPKKAQDLAAQIEAHGEVDDPAAVLRVAEAQYDAGRPDLARPLLRRVVGEADTRTWLPAAAMLFKVELVEGHQSDLGDVLDELLASNQNKLESWQGLSAILFDLQQWDLARRALDEWARLDPTNADPLRQLVAVMMFTGDDEGLWRSVGELLQRVPDPHAELTRLARQFQRRLRPDLAHEAWRRLHETDRANADMSFQMGDAALLAGWPDKATAAFDRYVTLSDRGDTAQRHAAVQLLAAGYADAAAARIAEGLKGGPTWRLLLVDALRLLREGEVERAVTAVEEAAALSPAPELVYLELAGTLLERPDTPAPFAERMARKALSIKANLPQALLVRAVAALVQGRGDEAEQDMERYATLGYEVADGHVAFARQALVAGRLDLAERHFDRFLGLQADREQALQQIAAVVREVNEREDLGLTEAQREQLRELSLGYVTELLQSDPSAAWFVTLQSDVLETSGDISGAVAVYREAMSKSPMDSALYNNLAYLYARRGENLEEALSLVRQARALDPSQNVFYLDTEGWILFQMGRYEEALPLVEGSIRQMEAKQGASLSESYWHQGQILEKLDRLDAAELSYRTAARLDPVGRYGRRAATDLTRLGER